MKGVEHGTTRITLQERAESGRQRKGKQAAKQQGQEQQQKDPRENNEMIPHVGRPLDGSQYLDVVEEQAWADRRPSPEEEKRRHTALDK